MVKRISNILIRCIRELCIVVLTVLTVLVSGCTDEKEVYSLEEILSREENEVKEEKAKETVESSLPTVWVHICGEVGTPGIYELPQGSRVYDVLVLAGGFTAEADTTHYNLAHVLNDGMKLEIPGRTEDSKGITEAADTTGVADSSGAAATIGITDNSGTESATGITGTPVSAEPEKFPVNINTATAEQLQTLPGIGKSRAADIVSYRERNGYFQNIEQIKEVSGIKEAVFEKIKGLITVDL